MILNKIEEGNNIALISDAGTPVISDPGEFIVKEAQKGKTLDLVVTVGEGASFIAKQVEETSNIAVKICKDNEEAAAFVKKCAKEGDWILVKGSRGMHMDEVVQKVVM